MQRFVSALRFIRLVGTFAQSNDDPAEFTSCRSRHRNPRTPGTVLTPRSATETGIEAFMAHFDHRQPGTRNAYHTDLQQFALFLHTCIAGPTVTNIAPPHVQAFATHLAREGRQPRTIARKLSAVRALFRFLQATGVRADNPGATVHPPEAPTEPDTLTAAQVASLLQLPERGSFTGARNRAMLELLYGAGLRLDELLGLNLSHLDLEEEGVRLQRGGSAWVPLGAPATAALRDWLLARAEVMVQRQMSDVDAGALFVSARGRRLRARTVQRLVERYVRVLDRKEGGWERESMRRRRGPGTLRAACERHLVDNGADPGLVAALLGRSRVTAGRGSVRGSADVAAIAARYKRAHPRA